MGGAGAQLYIHALYTVLEVKLGARERESKRHNLSLKTPQDPYVILNHHNVSKCSVRLKNGESRSIH